MTEVQNSPEGWVAEHIDRYVETKGEEGHIWNGVPTLLLTTTGRKSGVGRRTALIYGRDGDDLVIVASQGGAPTHPAWYLNLLAQPRVQLQVGAEVYAADASAADGDERDRLWKLMSKIWPAYDEYQTKTSRQIPVVVLRRVAG